MMPRRRRALRHLAAPMLAVAAWPAAAAGGEALTGARYVALLKQIDGALAEGDLAQAAAVSASCADAEVSWAGGRLRADPTVAVLIRASASAQARLRIAAVLDACAAQGGAAGSGAVSAPRLARIAEEEAAGQRLLARGGEIDGLPDGGLALPVSWHQRIAGFFGWLGDGLRTVWDWIIDWLRAREDKGHADAAGSRSHVLIISCVLVGAILVVAAVMAWRAWRQRSMIVPRMAGAPAADGVDADPRSRAVDEWLAYAQQLFAAGRHREATRAWFHALLVQCWSHGLIHHRVGKTNWEYALLLPASLPWRSRFQDLTRQYDCIWYGGRDDREAVERFAGETGEILGRLRPAAGRP
jgi:hypothetical protein